MKSQKEDSIREMVIDRIEEDKAVLTSLEMEVIIPKALLPKGSHEGDVLVLSLVSKEIYTKKREATAKALLNEILKNN